MSIMIVIGVAFPLIAVCPAVCRRPPVTVRPGCEPPCPANAVRCLPFPGSPQYSGFKLYAVNDVLLLRRTQSLRHHVLPLIREDLHVSVWGRWCWAILYSSLAFADLFWLWPHDVDRGGVKVRLDVRRVISLDHLDAGAAVLRNLVDVGPFHQAQAAAPDTAPLPVLHGLLESTKGITVRCLRLGDFFPHDSGLRSGAARAAMSLRLTRSASPGIPP